MPEPHKSKKVDPPPTVDPTGPQAASPSPKKPIEIPRPFRPFPLEQMPLPLRRFVEACAKAIGCDPVMIVMPVLSVLASAVGNSHRIQLKRGWSEPSCLWSVVIIDSGKLKSPAFDQAISAFQRRQQRMLERHAQATRDYEAEKEKAKQGARTTSRRRGGPVHDGPPSSPPICERLYCNDVTIEALADRLSDAPRGLLTARDELSGLFGSFDQYKASKGADVALWLELHRGGPLTVDRKSAERKVIFIPRALVSITGGIQPTVLQSVLSAEYFVNGLAARFLMAMPPFRQKVWTEDEITEEVLDEYDQLVGALLDLAFAHDPEGRPIPQSVVLSPEAKADWVAFYNAHGAVQAEIDGDLAAAFSKLEGYAARLALVFHLIGHVTGDKDCSEQLVCGRESIRRGIAVARWFCDETERIYAILRETAEEQETRTLIERIERNDGSMTARRLQQLSRRYPTTELAEGALEKLVVAEMGVWRDRPSTDAGGRPTKDFVLHPLEVRLRNLRNRQADAAQGGSVGSVDAPGDAQKQSEGPSASEEVRI